MALIDTCKMAMRVTTSAYDTEIQTYIESAMLDLGIAGVEIPQTADALVNKAVLTYVRMSFGSPSDYDKLKESYDEQKAQLMNATGYTDWGVGA
jgi:ATP phosphoribosyltransferase